MRRPRQRTYLRNGIKLKSDADQYGIAEAQAARMQQPRRLRSSLNRASLVRSDSDKSCVTPSINEQQGRFVPVLVNRRA